MTIVLLLLAIFPLYQLYALNNTKVQSFMIEKVSMDKSLLFVIDGEIVVANPSAIPVTIKQIDYTGIIENEAVFNGTLKGQTVPAGGNVSFQFSQEIDWVPDSDTAVAIVSGKSITLTIHVKPQASYLYLFTLTGKKEINIEISKLLKPYIEKQIANVNKLLTSLLKS